MQNTKCTDPPNYNNAQISQDANSTVVPKYFCINHHLGAPRWSSLPPDPPRHAAPPCGPRAGT
eukprot:7373373-Lingulodinium_polyedra.AAC.1